ncbi:MAG: ABC transporter ATP-binding protein [Nitrospirota bacterium]|nr:MAG: ABC transporter ATP-binding protein [Nitrospirota bacterium]
MEEFAVGLRKVVKFHGDTIAVDDVSLDMTKGEFFSILGPSGSGKTTTLRLIAGLDRPDQGEIFIQGRSMNHVPPHQRPVNMVFQNYALFPHMTVYHNVAFGLQMRGHSVTEIKSQVGETLELVKLHEKPHRYPTQLSGGEQQRVALARALVNRPAILLLDEPLGALDQQLRQEMQVELKEIQARVQSTFVCVTHHQEEALMLSDRVAVMDRGQILQVGTPQEIYESPVSTFVAHFIGLSNSVVGRISNYDGTMCTVMTPYRFSIQATTPKDHSSAEEVTVIVRPERVHLSPGPKHDGYDNSLPALINKVSFNGGEMFYKLDLQDGLVWTARVPMALRPSHRFQVGQHVYVQWHADHGLVLTH